MRTSQERDLGARTRSAAKNGDRLSMGWPIYQKPVIINSIKTESTENTSIRFDQLLRTKPGNEGRCDAATEYVTRQTQQVRRTLVFFDAASGRRIYFPNAPRLNQRFPTLGRRREAERRVNQPKQDQNSWYVTSSQTKKKISSKTRNRHSLPKLS